MIASGMHIFRKILISFSSLLRKAWVALLAPLSFLYLVPVLALAQASQSVQNPLGPAGASFCTLIKAVLNAAMLLGVPVAVLLIIYAGFRFVLAQGNSTKLESARSNFLYTVLGILIFFGAVLISNVIIGTLQAFSVNISSC